MKVFKKFGKLTTYVAILSIITQIFVGFMPASALAPGPVLDDFQIVPSNGVSTSTTPSLRTHATALGANVEIIGCQYRYMTDVSDWSGWLEGDYSPDMINDITPMVGLGVCASPEIDVTGATQFSGEIRVTDSEGLYTDSGVSVLNVSTASPSVTVQSVTTNNNPLPTITGTIDDPSALIVVQIHNSDNTVFSLIEGTNFGSTWSATVTGYLPRGVYAIDVIADNSIYRGEASGTYTVNPDVFTISFNTAGGSRVSKITQDVGTVVRPPANPKKTGYTFNGWSSSFPATMPAHNLTLTALWKVNTAHSVTTPPTSGQALIYSTIGTPGDLPMPETDNSTVATDTEVLSTPAVIGTIYNPKNNGNYFKPTLPTNSFAATTFGVSNWVWLTLGVLAALAGAGWWIFMRRDV